LTAAPEVKSAHHLDVRVLARYVPSYLPTDNPIFQRTILSSNGQSYLATDNAIFQRTWLTAAPEVKSARTTSMCAYWHATYLVSVRIGFQRDVERDVIPKRCGFRQSRPGNGAVSGSRVRARVRCKSARTASMCAYWLATYLQGLRLGV